MPRTQNHLPDHLFDPHYSTGWSGCGCGTRGWVAQLRCSHEVWSHGKGQVGAYISCPSCQAQRKIRNIFPRPDVGRSPVSETLENLSRNTAKRVVHASRGGYSNFSDHATPPVSRVRKQPARSTKEVAMPRRGAVAEPEAVVEETPDYTSYAGKEPTPTMEWFADWLIEEVFGGALPKDWSEDDFREGVRLGGTLRMEFQRSDMNKTRREELREQRAAEAAEAKASRKSARAAADTDEDEDEDEEGEDEAPARPARRTRGAAKETASEKAPGRGRPAGKASAAKASTATAKAPARRGRATAKAGAEAPF